MYCPDPEEEPAVEVLLGVDEEEEDMIVVKVVFPFKFEEGGAVIVI